MEAWARVPGCCGELVEGLWGEAFFLVSAPVDLYATVRVRLAPGRGLVLRPAEHGKTRRAVRATLTHLGAEHLGGVVEVRSPLPPGKGLGSSSADVCAAIAATACALGRELAPSELACLAVAVEPTNSTFAPGLALFDHLGASFLVPLGPPPPLSVLVLDLGGTVDTLAFNRRPDLRARRRENQALTNRALQLILAGLRRNNPRLLAEGATLSAWANQSLLPRPGLKELASWLVGEGALGLCLAHSGTVVGALLEPAYPGREELAREVAKYFPQVRRALPRRLVGGGVQVGRAAPDEGG